MAEATIRLPASRYFDIGSERGWINGLTADTLPAAFMEGTQEGIFTRVTIEQSGTSPNFTYRLSLSVTPEFSSAVETNGHAVLSFDDESLKVTFGGDDTENPYDLPGTTQEQAAMAAFWDEMPMTNRMTAGTLVISDGQQDGAIKPAGKGTSAVTASATLTESARGAIVVTATGSATIRTETATLTVSGATVTTDTDRIYLRAATAPSAPTGGAASENHLPAGWSRVEPSPTTTLNVYRASRVRTYTGGTFTSATAWGSVSKVADAVPATGGLTELQWHDAAPDLSDATSKLWRAERAVPGAPAAGASKETGWGDWTEPVVVGELGRGVEFIFARYQEATFPANRRPSNDWGYDSPGTVGSDDTAVTWSDAAPNVNEEFPYLWQSQREVIGVPAVGDSVKDEWTEPRITGRLGVQGQDGVDGSGTEFLFAATVSDTAPTAPDNDWGYETPGTDAGEATLTPSVVWFDGEKGTGFGQAKPYLWRVRRTIPGTPPVGADIDDAWADTYRRAGRTGTPPSGDWSSPAIVGHFGADGAAGVAGTVWFFGTGAPDDALGKNGDLYLNETTAEVYEKKNDAWAKKTSFRGADGAVWDSGSDAPSDSDGNDGDWYFRTGTGAMAAEIYRKVSGSWVKQVDIDQGGDGSKWLSGSGDPAASLGNVGDWYFNTANGHVWEKLPD